jgi:anti-sigma factor RsiW
MECKRIQELIITDYADGELDQARTAEVERHLAVCARCREFREAAERTVVGPLKAMRPLTPPERVWEKIREEITRTPTPRAVPAFAILKSKLRGAFVIRRPALAVAAMAIALIITIVSTRLPLNGTEAISLYLEDQMQFLSSLDASDTRIADANGFDLDTGIEEYLL